MESMVSARLKAIQDKIASMSNGAGTFGSGFTTAAGNLRAIETQFARTAGSASVFGRAIDKVAGTLNGGLGIGAAVGGLALLTRGFELAIQKARQFQTAQIAIAASLSSAYKFQSGSQTLTGPESYRAATRMSGTINQAIIDRQAKNILTYQEQLGAFQSSIVAGAKKGLNPNQILDVTERIAVVAKTLGLHGEQIANASRILLGGATNISRSTVGRALGITNEDIKGLKGTDLQNFIMSRTQGFAQAAPDFKKSIEGVLSTLEAKIDLFANKVGQKFMKLASPIIEGFSKSMEGAGSDRAATVLANGFQSLATGISAVANSPALPIIQHFIEFLAQYGDKLLIIGAIAKFGNLLKGVSDGVGNLTGQMSGLTKASAAAATEMTAVGVAETRLSVGSRGGSRGAVAAEELAGAGGFTPWMPYNKRSIAERGDLYRRAKADVGEIPWLQHQTGEQYEASQKAAVKRRMAGIQSEESLAHAELLDPMTAAMLAPGQGRMAEGADRTRLQELRHGANGLWGKAKSGLGEIGGLGKSFIGAIPNALLTNIISDYINQSTLQKSGSTAVRGFGDVAVNAATIGSLGYGGISNYLGRFAPQIAEGGGVGAMGIAGLAGLAPSAAIAGSAAAGLGIGTLLNDFVINKPDFLFRGDRASDKEKEDQVNSMNSEGADALRLRADRDKLGNRFARSTDPKERAYLRKRIDDDKQRMDSLGRVARAHTVNETTTNDDTAALERAKKVSEADKFGYGYDSQRATLRHQTYANSLEIGLAEEVSTTPEEDVQAQRDADRNAFFNKKLGSASNLEADPDKLAQLAAKKRLQAGNALKGGIQVQDLNLSNQQLMLGAATNPLQASLAQQQIEARRKILSAGNDLRPDQLPGFTSGTLANLSVTQGKTVQEHANALAMIHARLIPNTVEREYQTGRIGVQNELLGQRGLYGNDKAGQAAYDQSKKQALADFDEKFNKPLRKATEEESALRLGTDPTSVAEAMKKAYDITGMKLAELQKAGTLSADQVARIKLGTADTLHAETTKNSFEESRNLFGPVGQRNYNQEISRETAIGYQGQAAMAEAGGNRSLSGYYDKLAELETKRGSGIFSSQSQYEDYKRASISTYKTELEKQGRDLNQEISQTQLTSQKEVADHQMDLATRGYEDQGKSLTRQEAALRHTRATEDFGLDQQGESLRQQQEQQQNNRRIPGLERNLAEAKLAPILETGQGIYGEAASAIRQGIDAKEGFNPAAYSRAYAQSKKLHKQGQQQAISDAQQSLEEAQAGGNPFELGRQAINNKRRGQDMDLENQRYAHEVAGYGFEDQRTAMARNFGDREFGLNQASTANRLGDLNKELGQNRATLGAMGQSPTGNAADILSGMDNGGYRSLNINGKVMDATGNGTGSTYNVSPTITNNVEVKGDLALTDAVVNKITEAVVTQIKQNLTRLTKRS